MHDPDTPTLDTQRVREEKKKEGGGGRGDPDLTTFYLKERTKMDKKH